MTVPSAEQTRQLEAYRQHSAITDPHDQRDLLLGIPSDIVGLSRVVHGSVIHLNMGDIYNCVVPEERKPDSDTRDIATILRKTRAIDPRPLVETRQPVDRFVGHCRVAALVMTMLLREQGYAARVRAGFSKYFASFYGDHYLTEVWNDADQRWVLVDPEYDDILREATKVEFDAYDVPRDKFMVAGEAWRLIREGKLDPQMCGLDLDEAGINYVRGMVLRDLANLCRVEVSAIDTWGLGAKAEADLTADDLTLLDHLAELTEAATPAALEEACHLFHTDDRLRFTL